MRTRLTVVSARAVAAILALVVLVPGPAQAQKKFLFDATKAETAGNADWVIDEDNNVPGRFPTPPESTVTQSTAETYWTGALSSWGIALVKLGHLVETLPPGKTITYGDSTNPQDLRNYDVFIVDEPNTPFSSSEKASIVRFVQNGGGLFMISDHAGADRNNDGWDAVRIWNDLMRNNSVQSLPFGMLVDSTDYSETTTNLLADTTDPVLHGPAGPVTELKYSDGATLTLDPSTNPTVKALIWRNGYPHGLANVMCATAQFGAGKAFLIGDSSPADDGTGASGNSLYPGWTEVGVSHADLHLNASLWLANRSTTTTAGTLTFSARSLSFGDVGVNDSAAMTLAVKNSSAGSVLIDSIATATTTFRCAVGNAVVSSDSLKIAVTFSPTSFGGANDTLLLRCKAESLTVRIPLTGNCPYPAISVNPQSLSFGQLKKDSVSELLVSMTNTSLSVLVLDSLFTGSGVFQVVPRGPRQDVRKGDTAVVEVFFHPDTLRSYLDTLYVSNNSQVPLLKVPLSGSGVLTGVSQQPRGVPASFELFQNFPNPFNPTTSIRFTVPARSRVVLEVFNVVGQRLVTLLDGERPPGSYEVEWGNGIASGLYFCRLTAVESDPPNTRYRSTKRMSLIK